MDENRPQGENPTYRDPDRSTEARVEDLLSRMTPAEKVGQLVGTAPTLRPGRETVDGIAEAVTEHHLGAVSPFGHGGSPWETPEECIEVANAIQREARNNTRLGIPVLLYVDADHGHGFVKGTTVFPHNLGMAATRDPALVERAASVTATEVAATGAHQNLNPVADVGREARWGRIYETFGESPHLCAAMSAAAVRGYQGDDVGDPDSVIATPKHFPAYSDPVRGEDGSPVDVSEYTLRRVFRPPFEAAIDAGAGSIMPAYNELNGYPVHGSTEYLTGWLREELDFSGYVVSDWNGINMLHHDHRTARSMDEAVWQAATAGVDVASVGGVEHAERLLDLLEAGELAESTIDESVRRVLGAKFRLGLFDDPYVEADRAETHVGTDDHRAVAREAARESMTLLQNDDGVLPFDSALDSIAVLGPNADTLRNQFGGWSTISEPEPPGTTIREGIERAVPAETTVRYEQGASVTETVDIDAARKAADASEAAVVVVGETGYRHEFHRSETDRGEFPTRSQLELPRPQRELLGAVRETGTPTVAVFVAGRPLAMEWTAEHVPAILFAYLPGSEGGKAVADVLFGDADPGGSLPVSIPRSMGHLPTHFDYRPHPHPIEGSPREENPRPPEHPETYDPLFPFGHGLSYADFETGGLSVSPGRVGPEGHLTVTVEVENVSDRAGSTTLHLYGTDEFSSRVTPVRELVGFEKVDLTGGERTEVTFDVDVSDLGVVTETGERRAEPGTVTLSCRGDAADVTVERRFER